MSAVQTEVATRKLTGGVRAGMAVLATDICGGTVELPNGWSAHWRTEQGEGWREPWKEHDGHGVVSEKWRDKSSKRPNEKILIEDCDSCRFYDVQASLKIALKDQWGCGKDEHKHKTKRETAACAVEQDFQHLKRWWNGDWCWMVVSVILKDANGEVVEADSLDGVESDGSYWRECVADMINQLAAGKVLPYPYTDAE